jgi:hypothetical protein
MLDSPFWRTGIDRLIDSYAALIEPYVATDERDLNGSVEDWRANVEAMRSFLAPRREHLKQMLCD